jgi:hypothetical protein
MTWWDASAAYHTLSGATMFGFFLAAVYFLRFWRRTRDRLFLLFAISFFVMAGQRVVVVLLPQLDESVEVALYSLRFVAFLLILAAILDKNRASDRAELPPGDPGSGPRTPRGPARKLPAGQS